SYYSTRSCASASSRLHAELAVSLPRHSHQRAAPGTESAEPLAAPATIHDAGTRAMRQDAASTSAQARECARAADRLCARPCSARRVGIRFPADLPGSVTVAQQVLVFGLSFPQKSEILGNFRVKLGFGTSAQTSRNVPKQPLTGVQTPARSTTVSNTVEAPGRRADGGQRVSAPPVCTRPSPCLTFVPAPLRCHQT